MGSLLATHMTSVSSAHSSLAGLSLSRSIPLYLLVAWVSVDVYMGWVGEVWMCRCVSVGGGGGEYAVF